jgi:hypothetical protein
MELGSALVDLLRAYCEAKGITYKNSAGQSFCKQLQSEALKNAEELVGGQGGILQAAQRMWTCVS